MKLMKLLGELRERPLLRKKLFKYRKKNPKSSNILMFTYYGDTNQLT